MGNAKQRYIIDGEQLNNICKIAAEAGIEVYRNEMRKAERKKEKQEDKGRKTKKMLSAYRRMKATLEDEEEFTEDEKIELRWKFISDLMDPTVEAEKEGDTIRESEKRRRENAYCVHRIEKAAELYEIECSSGSEEAQRRFKELSMMYLDEQLYTVEEIAELENISTKTVYKDLGIACNIMSVYLLGI